MECALIHWLTSKTQSHAPLNSLNKDFKYTTSVLSLLPNLKNLSQELISYSGTDLSACLNWSLSNMEVLNYWGRLLKEPEKELIQLLEEETQVTLSRWQMQASGSPIYRLEEELHWSSFKEPSYQELKLWARLVTYNDGYIRSIKLFKCIIDHIFCRFELFLGIVFYDLFLLSCQS